MDPSTAADPARPLGPYVWLLYGLIVVLAILLRVFPSLNQYPPGLFRDEAEKGYNAWALATTGGVVEFGAGEAAGEGQPAQAVIGYRRWPLVIDVMGVKTSAIYQYAAAPFVGLGGLTPAMTRAPAALAGALTVALLGLVLMRVWAPSYALAAMLWLAFSPWHIVFSRWALQGIFVPLFLMVTLGGLAALHARPPRRRGSDFQPPPVDPATEDLLERPPFYALPLACAGLGLAFYSYSGAQPFVLAFGAGLLVFYRRAIAARPLAMLLGLSLFALFAAPRIASIVGGGGGARLSAIAVWGADAGQPRPGGGEALFAFVRNYLAHYSPLFLFFQGDSLPRHSVPGLGQLLPIDLVFLPLGIWISFRRRLPLRRALLLIFLTAPLSAAITRVGIPHALRSLPMALPAAVWGGVGLAAAALWVHARLEERLKSAKDLPLFPQLRRPLFLTSLFLLAAVTSGIQAFRAYVNACTDRDTMQMAFAASERAAFERACAAREDAPAAAALPQGIMSEDGAGAEVLPPLPTGATVAPHQLHQPRVFVDASILYGPYYALFFCRLPPQLSAAGGLESQGFFFFPPGAQPRLAPLLRPGDLIIELDRETGIANMIELRDVVR